ncbi:MAG: hypothetical protein CK550_07615 [Gemmatimonadetes bacterium]|nr:MAG: hypothetical protein CK550_07615 [Gemmatimonadota bacterium]
MQRGVETQQLTTLYVIDEDRSVGERAQHVRAADRARGLGQRRRDVTNGHRRGGRRFRRKLRRRGRCGGGQDRHANDRPRRGLRTRHAHASTTLESREISVHQVGHDQLPPRPPPPPPPPPPRPIPPMPPPN